MSEASDSGAGAPAEDAVGTAVSGPSAGERARTMAYGVADGVLALADVPGSSVTAHVTEEDGRPLLLVPANSAAVRSLRGGPAGDGAGGLDVPATLRITDVAPVPLADRVRGRAWLHGWVRKVPEDERHAAALRISRLHSRPELLDFGTGPHGPGGSAQARSAWTILALEIAEVEIQDAWGCAALEAEEYAAAAPDPFVAIEGGVIGHLDECHRAELLSMLRRLNGVSGVPHRLGGADPVVRPLALDRYGMWLRCSAAKAVADAPVDLRVVFGRPVSDIHGLRHVYRRLFAGAHS
jgi:hypothetical protein